MRSTAVARNYAEAVFRLGQAAKANDRIEDELVQLSDLVRGTDLGAYWHNPMVEKADKQALADRFMGGMHPYVVNLVRVLIERNRIDYLADIAAQFDRVRDRLGRDLHVTVLTRFPLSDKDEAALTAKLKALSDRALRVTVRQDHSVIGGIRVLIHDRMLDGSVRAKLESLRRRLLEQLQTLS